MARSSFSRRAGLDFRRRIVLEALERRELLASYTTPEDTRLLVSDPAFVAATIVGQPLHGKVFLTDVGGFAYEPELNYNGPDQFLFVVANTSTPGTTNALASEVHEASITVTPVNDAPEARNDEYHAYRNTALTIAAPGVLKNDHDVDNEDLKAKVKTQPANGTLVLNENGGFTYAPKADFVGVDSFAYVATDGLAESNEAKVWIVVKALPDARDDQVSVPQNTSTTIAASTVLANDVPVTNFGLLVSLERGGENDPKHGTVTEKKDDNGKVVGFVYTPVTGYFGPDSFVYRATDATPTLSPLPPAFDLARVWIFVRQVPTAVVANDDSYSTLVGKPLEIAHPGVLKNDFVLFATPIDPATSNIPGTSPLNFPLTAKVVDGSGPKHGTLTLKPEGGFLYTPNPDENYVGIDTFVYVATLASTATGGTAGTNALSDTATVTIHVRQLPDARDDQYSALQNTVLTVPPKGVLTNDVPVTGHGLTAKLEKPEENGPKHGSVTLNPDGSFTYKPHDNYFGPDSFVYRATDVPPEGEATPESPPSDLATVHLYVRPNPIVLAKPDFYTTLVNTPLPVEPPGVLKNDVVLYVDPTNPNQPATDTNTTTAVNPPLVAALVGERPVGLVEFNSNGSFRYEPPAGFTGEVKFRYQAKLATTVAGTTASGDSGSPSNEHPDITTVTIIVKPLPLPQANDDHYRTLEDTELKIEAPGVLQNDRGVEGHRLTAKLVSEVTSGELNLNEDGSFSYKPVDGFTGFAWFTYRAVDANATTPAANTTMTGDIGLFAPRPVDVAMVTIYVQPARVPVYAFDDAYKAWANLPLEIAAPGVLANDTIVPPPLPLTPDLDSPTIGSNDDGTRPWPIPPVLTAKLLTRPANGELSFNENGSFKYVPKEGFSGIDTFTYQAIAGDGEVAMPAGASMLSMPCTIDAAGNSILPCPAPPDDIATVTIFVRAPEPPPGPVAVDDHFLTAAHTTLEVRKPGVLANDYVRHLAPIAGTVDNSPVRPPLVAVLLTQPENGTLSLNPDGSFKYEPKDGFTGIDKFTYQALLETPGTTGSATDAADGILPNLSNVATVTIRVVPAVAHGDSYSTLQDTELKVEAPGVLGNDDGGTETQPLVAKLLRGPLNGTVELKSDGSFVYVPKQGYVGPDLFTYRAGDGSVVGDPNTATSNALASNVLTNNAVDVGLVKIYVRPKTPEVKANDDKYVTRKNTTLTIAAPGVLANDLRPANVPLMASIVERPEKGTLELKADGSFTYAPETDFVGAVKLTYRASLANTTGAVMDGSIGGSIATVTIYMLAEDHLPGFIPGGDLTTTDESGEQKVADWATLVSIGGDGGPANFVVTTDKPHLFEKAPAIDATGQLAFTPAPNASGTARVTVAMEGTASESASFEIQVDKPHPLYNAAEPCDVDGDLAVAPGDALEIINYLNAVGSTPANLPEGEAGGAVTYYDVDGDGVIAAGDALEVINFLNAGLAAAGPADAPEGEHAAATDLSILALTADDAGGTNQRRRRSS